VFGVAVNTERAEFIVLGAGVSGSALAYHLARKPGSSVFVIDPRGVGGGASGRGAGVLTEQLWDPWDIELVRESRSEYRALPSDPREPHFQPASFVRWTHRSGNRSALEEAEQRLQDWGVRVRRLGAPELSARIPEARFSEHASGLLTEDDALVDPPTLTRRYAEAAEREGVRFVSTGPIGPVLREAGGYSVTVAQRTYRSPHLILATGAWTPAIAAGLGAPLPIVPYRTQAARFRPSAPVRTDLPVGHDIDEDIYLRPAPEGTFIAGDGTTLTEEDPDRFDPEADGRFREHLERVLPERWPRWAGAPLERGWAGVVDATPDRRPLVGEVPGLPGAFVIAGFNGFGIMRAGATARRLANLLRRPDDEVARDRLAPADPARFRLPHPPFQAHPGFTVEPGDDPRL
jgi:sarcosine oxidase subunit beta